MSRWVPYPLLALALFILWLLLTQSFSPGQALLGLAVSLLATSAMAALQPDRAPIRRRGALLRLAARVAVDVVRSNIAVATIILFPRQERVAGFIRLPLDLRSRPGLTALAVIITATPGTLWVEFDEGKGILLVHVLDLIDEQQWIDLVKHRYEALLLEIFG